MKDLFAMDSSKFSTASEGKSCDEVDEKLGKQGEISSQRGKKKLASSAMEPEGNCQAQSLLQGIGSFENEASDNDPLKTLSGEEECMNHLFIYSIQPAEVTKIQEEPVKPVVQKSRKRISKDDVGLQRHEQQGEKHLRWFSHGRRWTIVGLVFAFLGFSSSVLARRSTEFVSLRQPLELDPVYLPVYHIGMIHLKLCSNFTWGPECSIISMSSDDVDDRIFDLARILITMATVLGGFLTLCLSTAIFWQSINLKPIAAGFLLTYFLESFAMVFFDIKICEGGNCRVGLGCGCCIFSSICWVGSCISTAKMDAVKLRAQRRRRRQRKKSRSRHEDAKEVLPQTTTPTLKDSITMQRDNSTSTAATEASEGSIECDYDEDSSTKTPRGLHSC